MFAILVLLAVCAAKVVFYFHTHVACRPIVSGRRTVNPVVQGPIFPGVMWIILFPPLNSEAKCFVIVIKVFTIIGEMSYNQVSMVRKL